MNKRIVHIVLNQFTHDSRVIRQCKSLVKKGYKVNIVAIWANGLPYYETEYGYDVIRIPIFTKSWSKNPIIQIIKYLEFVVRSLYKIKKIKPAICHGHDPSGLLVAFGVKYIFNSKLIYDSHELWSNSIHLQGNKKILFKIGRKIEKYLIKRTDEVITVNKSIAEILSLENNIKSITIIRNMPEINNDKSKFKKDEFDFPECNFNLIYVGNIENGRGIDIIINAMELVDDNIGLVLMGKDSEYKTSMEVLSNTKNYNNRIKFLKAVEPDQVVNICRLANVGISPTQNLCKSYYLSLPNKIFQYIEAGIPVLASDFPEMKNIIENYNVGMTFSVTSSQSIANSINTVYNDHASYQRFCYNSKIASNTLNWETEQNNLYGLYKKLD